MISNIIPKVSQEIKSKFQKGNLYIMENKGVTLVILCTEDTEQSVARFSGICVYSSDHYSGYEPGEYSNWAVNHFELFSGDVVLTQ